MDVTVTHQVISDQLNIWLKAGPEYMVFSDEFVNICFSMEDIRELQCSAIITDELSLLLKNIIKRLSCLGRI